jgi:UDP-N-acetylmuramyl pentapeptide synthase
MIADAARKAGMNPAHIFEFEERRDVVAWLVSRIGKQDAVLVKGSRALSMDRIVAELEAA